MKSNSEKPVNVHSEKEMIEAGLRIFHSLIGRDDTVWSKTKKERKQLDRIKYSAGEISKNSCAPRKTSYLRDKLIVYLKKNKNFDKSTYSIICWKHEIPFIISSFINNKGDSLVNKYYFNGRTYTV